MTEHPPSAAKLSWGPVALAVGLTALAYHAKAVALSATTPLILDSDDAMRLVQVQDLLGGQGWFDLTQHRLNTPFGGSMHWSRLVDAPEAAWLALVQRVAGENALVVMAWTWPLLLLVPLFIVSLRLAATLTGGRPLWPVLVLLPLSLITLGEFVPGRVDHHAIQILLTLAMTDLLLRGLETSRRAARAGVAGAAAIAVGIEGLPMVAAAGLGLAVAFVVSPRYGAALRDFALGLCVGAVLGLATTVAPAEWGVVRLDAISVVYVALAGIAAAIAVVATQLRLRAWLQRGVALAGLGGAGIAGLVIAFPALLRGPYAALDPWLVDHWLLSVAESQSFLTSLAADPVYPIAVTVPVVIALIAALVTALRSRHLLAPLGLYAVMLLAGLLVMLVQIRAARIVTPLAIAGDALAIGLLIGWAGRRGLLGAAAVIGGLLASSGFAVATVVSLVPVPEPATPRPNRQVCLMPSAYSGLAALPPARVMAPVDMGSHILLFTDNTVVGAPYHRNQSGLIDTFRFFNGPEAEARAIASSRGITRLVLCDAMPELRGLQDRAPDSLINRLAENALPDWISEAKSDGPLRIFTVSP